MLEELKAAVAEAVDTLKNNGEHRASLAAVITAAHGVFVTFEDRIAALEKAAEAGFAVAQTVGGIVDAATGAGAAQQPAA